MRLLGKTRENADKAAPLKDFSVIPGAQQDTEKNRRRPKYDPHKYDSFDAVEPDAPEPHSTRPDKKWHLNLRSQDVHKPANGWRRHFTRPFQTFDHLKQHLADETFREEYRKQEKTPSTAGRWRPDRQKGPWGGIIFRDDNANFTRAAGCEGSQAGLWMHLIQARHERAQVKFETTLREARGDDCGARICDNRNDGCIVEMLGKKKWYNSRPKSTDLKLHHLDFLKVEAEPDEDARQIRRSKTPRRDVALCGPDYVVSPSPSLSINSPSPSLMIKSPSPSLMPPPSREA